MNKTTIQITKETLAKLKGIGKKGETYDEVILRLLDAELNEPVGDSPSVIDTQRHKASKKK